MSSNVNVRENVREVLKINEFMMEEKQTISKMPNLMTGLRRNGNIVNKGSYKELGWFYID